MKNYFLIAIICLIFSCKNNTKQSPKDTTSASSTVENSDSLINKFKPLLQGTWVKKAYIDKVALTKSPLAATDEAFGLTTFIIDTDLIKSDSIKVDVGWGNHEGGEMTLKFKAGKHLSSVVFGVGEISLTTSGGNSILTYYHPDEKTKNIIATQYIKAQFKKPNALGEGTYYLVNKVLIAGDYKMIDSSGTSSKVNFDPHGKVKGFLDFSTYDINIDLNSGPMDNLDEIGFVAGNKKRQAYSFKFDADTLKLYNYKANADSTEMVLDVLRYKLVRQK